MDLQFKDEVWLNISEDAKDIIKRLLTSPEKRLTVDEALSHKWLAEESTNEMSKISTKILRRLSTFRNAKKLKKAVLMYIVSSLPSHKLEEERKEFIKMD
jgi:calcium-dependent protein kinase